MRQFWFQQDGAPPHTSKYILDQEEVFTGNRNCENFDPNARRLMKLEPNEIFNDFAVSRAPFDEIDSNFFYFKGI